MEAQEQKPIVVLFEDMNRIANAHPAMRIAARVRAKLSANRDRGIYPGVRRSELGGMTRALDTETRRTA